MKCCNILSKKGIEKLRNCICRCCELDSPSLYYQKIIAVRAVLLHYSGLARMIPAPFKINKTQIFKKNRTLDVQSPYHFYALLKNRIE